MSQTSSSAIVGIGPSGSSQLTIPLSTPTDTVPVSSSTFSTTTSMSTTSGSASPSATSGGSAASRMPNIGAIVGGTVGGVLALLWLAGLIWFAHKHNCFRRPGYERAREEGRAFEKQGRPRSGISEASAPFGNRPPAPPGPQNGVGARTFGEPPRPTYGESQRSTYDDPPRSFAASRPPPPPPKPVFGEPRNDVPEPPRNNFNNPPRNTFNDPPRTTFSEPPRTNYNEPPRSNFNDPPQSNYENRPISGFDRDRPRSGFGPERGGFGERPRSAYGDGGGGGGGGGGRRSVSQDRTRRGFFGGAQLHSDGTGGEWEGAGARRIEGANGTPEMEEKTGWAAWLTRVRDNAAQKKRVKAEYEEDMKQMRGRSAVESDYTRY